MTEVTIPISETQIKILKHLEKGLTQQEVAEELRLPLTTVKSQIYILNTSWNCKNVVSLISYAIRKGVI